MANWSRIARRIRVPLGFVFAVLYFWLARPSWISIGAGAVIAAMGVIVRAAASGHVRKDREVTTSGPYAYTRNPLYLGSTIIAAGFAVAARNWWIVLGVAALFAAIYVPVIRAEEQYLRSQFPEYDAYARQVPRFFPRGRVPNASAGAFSSTLYRQHREYNAALGTLAMLAALVGKLLWFH